MSNVEQLPFSQPGAYEPDSLRAFYGALRNSEQVGFYDTQTGYYVVHSYADVQQLLLGRDAATDRPTNAIDTTTTLDPHNSKVQLASNPACWPGIVDLARYATPATANASGEVHRAVKAAVYDSESSVSLNRFNTAGSYGARIEGIAQATIDTFEDHLKTEGTIDISAAFVRPLVSNVIAEVVGFKGQGEAVKQWSDAQSSLLGRQLSWRERPAAVRGLGDLARACHALAAERRAQPRKDLMSLLVGRKHNLPDTLAGSTAMNLIAAGYATTYGTLLNSLRRLSSSDDRHHWDNLAEPNYDKALVPELARLETGLVGWRRHAAKEITLSDGSVIPARKNILLLLGAANCDTNFDDPDIVQLRRPRKPQAVSFGLGEHLCMGREMANLEIGIALKALRRRFPTLHVPQGSSISYDADVLFRTPQSLPVAV